MTTRDIDWYTDRDSSQPGWSETPEDQNDEDVAELKEDNEDEEEWP